MKPAVAAGRTSSGVTPAFGARKVNEAAAAGEKTTGRAEDAESPRTRARNERTKRVNFENSRHTHVRGRRG